MTLRSRSVRLTAAELRVAQYVATGLTYERIGALLGIAASTVRVHVYHIADKLPNPLGIKPYPLVLRWSVLQWGQELQETSAA